jgi:hypothetical protein
MRIQTELISKSIPNPNPSVCAHHSTEKKMGEVIVWKSGFIDMIIFDIQSGEQIFYKHLNLSVKYSEIENLLDEYIEKLIKHS